MFIKIICKYFSLVLVYIILNENLYAQEKSKFDFNFSGYVKTDVFWDSRQTISSREGHFLLYPAAISNDLIGTDINAKANFNILSIQTRVTLKLTSPEVLNAKTSALIEGEFFGHSNPDINGFRLRHAYINLTWPNTSLLFGQTWHPMFIPEVFPGVLSFNTGAPFQPFSRNPQVRLSQKIGNVKLIAAMIAQRDFASPGPDGNNSSYLRNSASPNFHLQMQMIFGNNMFGIGEDYKTLAPRLKTAKGYATNNTIHSFSSIAYLKLNINPITIKIEGVLGNNLADHLMLGGYAVKSINQADGEEEYTNLKVVSIWSDLNYGKIIQYGLFMGYTKNLGSNEGIAGAVYSYINGIDYLYRISPRIQWIIQNITLAAEVELTSANFGAIDEKGKVQNSTYVSNYRYLIAAYYSF